MSYFSIFRGAALVVSNCAALVIHFDISDFSIFPFEAMHISTFLDVTSSPFEAIHLSTVFDVPELPFGAFLTVSGIIMLPLEAFLISHILTLLGIMKRQMALAL